MRRSALAVAACIMAACVASGANAQSKQGFSKNYSTVKASAVRSAGVSVGSGAFSGIGIKIPSIKGSAAKARPIVIPRPPKLAVQAKRPFSDSLLSNKDRRFVGNRSIFDRSRDAFRTANAKELTKSTLSRGSGRVTVSR